MKICRSILPLCFDRRFILAALGLIFIAGPAQAVDRQKPRMNAFGAAIQDAEGHGITYTREELAAQDRVDERAFNRADRAENVAPQGFVPAGGTAPPFWQYALFGSGIGLSNLLIGPAAVGGGAREIIMGGSSRGEFWPNDFWQVIRRNPATGHYDPLFVSPTYADTVKRIALGNVIGDSRQEIVVMLRNGRFYYYDLVTKAELGYVDTGITGLQGLSLADLDGNGYDELVAINYNPSASDGVFVFDNGGHLLWQVTGPFGSDVIAGQMDNDPALEIATTHGEVIDAGTRTVQWTHPGGLGYYLKLAPLPGANYQQLIGAEFWYVVNAYDVATQSVRWSIDTPQDIGAIEVADVDNDGVPEVIIGDEQYGTVHVHDLMTRAQKWAVNNPEHGVTNIAVGDVDNDGTVDLLWGAGYSSTGPDFLYVAGTTGSHTIKWKNVDLVGPFLGPLLGDLDGDGQPELVACSFESESGYESGRILVFDGATLALRGISAGVVGNLSWTGVHDLKLRDLEGDGRMEIVVAADRLYDGMVEIYGFNSSNTFTLKWSTTPSSASGHFTFVEVADLNGNGTPEIITGDTGYPAVHIYIYDYPSSANPWISVNLHDGSSAVTGLVVEDIDGNGDKEIAALVSTGELYTFDGPTRQIESLEQHTGRTLLSRRLPSGLISGDSAGVGHFLQYANNSYTESFSRQLGATTLDGVHMLSDGALWTGTGGTLGLRVPPSYDSVDWQSPFFGTGFGRFVAADYRNGQTRVFSAARHAVAGFNYGSTLPPPIPGYLGNISTRLRVETGDNILIGGFIVTGTQPKRIIVRAMGPSLPLAGALADPVLELRDSSGALILSNDNWRDDPAQESEIIATTIPPGNDSESAIVATLPANNAAYTAIIRGVNNGTGIGVVEVYDLDRTANSKLANISTRGLVQTDDNVLIAGTLVLGQAPQRVLVRAIGPSLPVSGKMEDPILELRDGNGGLLRSNDNWRSDQEAEIIATTIPPSDNLESAIVQTLPANGAAYTAIVRGVGGTTGIAVVEVYALN
jgi:hypothetical protein